uniref:Uncharacterized protein n=1 Tax=Oryza rufipogon TaxID=4529 RepID=A0A0E0RHX4_ORYRU
MAGPAARGRGAQRVAAAVHLPRHHRRDHHPASPARRRRAARPRRRRAHADAHVRRRVLRVRRPDPVAHRARLLLRPRLHQDRPRKPRRLRLRLRLRRLVARARLRARVRRGAAGAGHPVGVGARGGHLPAARQVAVRGVRLARRRRHGEEARVVADAHVLPDVGDLVGDVPHRHGSEPAGGEPDGGDDRAGDRVDAVGEGRHCAGLAVAGVCAVDSVPDLPAGGEDQPRRAAAGEGAVGEDGAYEQGGEDHGWNAVPHGRSLDLWWNAECGCSVCCNSWPIRPPDFWSCYMERVFGGGCSVGYPYMVCCSYCNGWIPQQIRVDLLVQ